MARSRMVFGVVGLAFSVTAAAAQPHPDFSGRWTAVPEAPVTGGGPTGAVAPATMGSGWGAEITITQTAATLTLERAQFSQYDMQPPMRLTYALDGSESRNTINMGRGPQELVSRASWQEASLVITTSHRFNNPQNGKAETIEVKQVLSLDDSGSLVIATTRSGVLAGPPATSATTYKKS
ncbi:MAG TPA: hypothetical protein VHI99_13580 [Vicinamibacterales bacterium]|jgi:hypothetical protein|nr:hypothetical protein [Vicinamibacterales bacterium]